MGTIPDLFLRGMGLFVPILREVAVMTYQWRGPFALDDTKFKRAFGASHTPPEKGVARTVEWAKANYP